MIKSLVFFKDNLEENSIPHFGLLTADNNIICLCCGGIVEPENYTILEYCGTEDLCYVDEILKRYF